MICEFEKVAVAVTFGKLTTEAEASTTAVPPRLAVT